MPPIEVIALVPLSLLLGYGLWWARFFAIRKQLRQPLPGVPSALASMWADAAPDPERARGKSLPEGAGLSVVEILFQLSRLDRSQLVAYNPQRLPTDFEELLGQLQQAAAVFQETASSQARNFAGGHAGEQLLAEQLRRQGHDVQLTAPGEPNNRHLPGWRAKVDGHPVQLIASADAEDVQRFLDETSDIPVVTLADHSEAFLDHALVLALEQVTHGHVRPQQQPSSTEESPEQPSHDHEQPSPVPGAQSADPTLSAVSGIGSMVVSRAANPLLLTAFRSAQLAASGDENWMAAARHGLVDQAGSAVGGWAGSRAGALAGGVLGPLGVAAGSWLGGLLGKKVGAGFANTQKQKKLRKLLLKQQRFLAAVPKEACASLKQQSRHLEAVTKQLNPPTEWWPGPGSIARREVAAQYRAWSKRSAERSRKLEKWLKDNPAESRRAMRGRKLLERGELGWSREMLELRAELLFLAPQLEAERLKLEQVEQH